MKIPFKPTKGVGRLGGVFVLVAAALSFSLATLSVKLLDEPVGSPQLVFLRSLFMVLAVGAWARWRGEPLILWPGRGTPDVRFGHRPGRPASAGDDRARPASQLFLERLDPAWLYWTRGVLGMVGFLLFFGALFRMPMGDTVIIFQAHPLFVAMLGPFFLGERLRPLQWAFVASSVAGVAIVVGASGGGDWLGRIMALGCAITTGMALVLVRTLRRRAPTLTIALAFPLVSVVVMGPALALDFPGTHWTWPSAESWLLIGGLALFGTIGQVLVTLGMGLLPAALAAPVANLQVVFALLFGVLFLGEHPSAATLGGAALIIASLSLLTATQNRREQ